MADLGKIRSTKPGSLKWTFGLFIILVLIAIAWLGVKSMAPKPAQDVVNLSFAAEEPLPITLPLDDGPHNVMTEWWYYTGQLKSDTGRTFSYHYTIFAHQTLATHTIVHASLLDHDTMQTYQFQDRTPGFQVNSIGEHFQLGFKPWQMTLLKTHDLITGENPEFAFRMKLKNHVPVVLQDEDAILEFKEAGNSYYYSRPRMPTKGIITLNHVDYEVEGSSWFDHQWGDFRAAVLNWDWFALQLENGADIMLFALQNADGAEVHVGGTLFQDGETTYLKKTDFTLTPGRTWTSPITKNEYTVEWHLSIPGHDVELDLIGVKDSSEFDARNTMYSAYWEGPITIKGTHRGVGFLEMSKSNLN